MIEYVKQIHKKGHATCSGCGKFVSKLDLKYYRNCTHIKANGSKCGEKF